MKQIELRSKPTKPMKTKPPNDATYIRCRVATKTSRSPADSKAGFASKLQRTSAIPRRSHILPNGKGPPMRFAETDESHL